MISTELLASPRVTKHGKTLEEIFVMEAEKEKFIETIRDLDGEELFRLGESLGFYKMALVLKGFLVHYPSDMFPLHMTIEIPEEFSDGVCAIEHIQRAVALMGDPVDD